jgi:hypothetical protein
VEDLQGMSHGVPGTEGRGVGAGRGRPRTPPVALALLCVIAAIIFWSRTSGLTFGFWNDEAFSVRWFIERGPLEIFLGAGVPSVHSLNNHRLFSLLAWATSSVLGTSEVVYRLWAVLPGIASALAVILWSARRIGPWVAVAVGVLVATAPLHVEVSTEARGYGLGLLAEAMILIGSVRAADGDRPRGGFSWLALGGLVGVFTLPVFALPFTVEAGVLLFVRRRRLAALAIIAAVGVASIAFYWPVLALIAEAGQQDFGPLVTWRTLFVGPYRDLAGGSLALIAPGVPELLRAASFAALMGLACLGLWRRGERLLLLLLVGPVLGTYAGLAMLGAHVVPRYVSYLLLHLLVLAAIGLVELAEVTARSRLLRAGVIAALILCAGLALARFRLLELERLSGPIEGYRDALEVARKAGLPIVVTDSRFAAGFDYYGRDLAVRFPSDDELQDLFCREAEPFVYVHYPLYGREVDLKCLYGRSPRVVAIPQRAGGPAGWMTVYVVRR